MIKFLKTYIPMVLSLLFLFVYSALINVALTNDINNSAGDNFFIFGIFVIILFFIEWLYFLIKSIMNTINAKDKSRGVLWIILVYLFNVFIVPYYNFKYVVKVNNIRLNTIIYIILAILFSVVGFLIPNIYF